jgi:adenylate kinase
MILILGNPGAGKTTQTELLAKHLGCPGFSMGELIRGHVTGEHRKQMLSGKIIDDELTMQIVDKALADLDLKNNECVFEGSPRSTPQAEWWLKQENQGRFKIKGLIHLVADPKIAEQRMISRGRLDDHDDNVIEKRYAEYIRSTKPTVDYLKQHGTAVYEIDGNQTIKQVEAQIHKVLGV